MKQAGIAYATDQIIDLIANGVRHIDLRKAARDINSAIGGRGGGRPEMIQGSTSETKEMIQKFVENVHV